MLANQNVENAFNMIQRGIKHFSTFSNCVAPSTV